jgi:hypothetical protein
MQVKDLQHLKTFLENVDSEKIKIRVPRMPQGEGKDLIEDEGEVELERDHLKEYLHRKVSMELGQDIVPQADAEIQVS